VIHLLVNTFTHCDPARNAELREALRINEANPALSVRPVGDLYSPPEERASLHKGTGITPGRLKFNDLLGIARRIFAQPERFESQPSDIIVIANADIYFDGSVSLLEAIGEREMWALSRWDDGKLYAHKDSQDVWAFRGPPPKINADFYVGTHGCDNKLAYLFNQAHYRVYNPSLSIRCHHLHSSGIRVVNREKFTVPGPYMMLPHTTIEEVLAKRNELAELKV
jgi:hypothetical protein